MKLLKRGLCVAVLAAVILCVCGCEGKQEQKLAPTKLFYSNDFADVIAEEAEAEIISRGAELASKTGAQVVVVTVKSTNGEEISEYTLNLAREWGVGDKSQNNGALVLLATEDRDVYVTVGYGLEGILPDSKVGRILDNYAVPYFSSNDFTNGILSLYTALQNEVYIEYGIEPEEGYVPLSQAEQENNEKNDFKSVVISWIVLISAVGIYIKIFGSRGLLLFMGMGNGRGSSGGFGGSSHGGFGGFSGGGGSFGGGGAGRGF